MECFLPANELALVALLLARCTGSKGRQRASEDVRGSRGRATEGLRKESVRAEDLPSKLKKPQEMLNILHLSGSGCHKSANLSLHVWPLSLGLPCLLSQPNPLMHPSFYPSFCRPESTMTLHGSSQGLAIAYLISLVTSCCLSPKRCGTLL